MKSRFTSKSILLILPLLVFCLASFFAAAQENRSLNKSIQIEHTPEGKIKVKVTKEENGETRTFEKEYANRDEMKSDPDYKEFFGDDNSIYWLDDNDNQFFSFDFGDNEDVIIDLKKNLDLHFDDNNFKFFFDGEDGNNVFRFDGEDMDEIHERILELRSDFDFNMHEYTEEMEEALEQVREQLKDINDQFDDFDIDFHIKPKGDDHKVIIIERKKLTIKEVENNDKDLRKLSKGSNTLELPNLRYYPNPNDGRFTLRFEVDETAPLKVRILDISGKEVYSESFSNFGGIFKKDLDLSNEETGIYLMEITSGGKKLTKKLVLE